MRYRVLVIALMLLAAACGGTDAEPATTAAAGQPTSTASAGSASTAAPDATENPGTTATPSTAARSAEGPIAPSFVTTLSDGSQFDMGTHDRPVYLVFWAEW